MQTMGNLVKNKKVIFFNIILLLLVFLFFISIFKNISYPLIWNDESDTIMFAQRISEFGYPKAHDGKNILNLFNHPNPKLEIKEKYDVVVTEGWAQYYFAVPGVLLAKMTEDIYLKTALIRIPFAIAGIVGLLILVLTILPIFKNQYAKCLFLIYFIFFELFSAVLTLHIREARYYSLVLFFSSVLLYIYVRYNILQSISQRLYLISVLILLWVLFITFYPVYIIMFIALTLYSSWEILKTVKIVHQPSAPWQNTTFTTPTTLGIERFFNSIWPVWTSIIFIIPCAIFFNTFTIADALSEVNPVNLSRYFFNINYIFSIFWKHEALYAVIIIKMMAIWYRQYARRMHKIVVATPFLAISNLFSLITVVFIVIFSGSPQMWSRYFVLLQPIMALILFLDLSLLYNIFKQWPNKRKRRYGIIGIAILLFLTLGIRGFLAKDFIQGHVYELSNQYQGPLDFAIPKIKEKYGNTEDLVIATNYEEFVYMYYLGSKVIVGFVGTNLIEDSKLQPDVMIFRKMWGRFHTQLFDFLQKAEYEEHCFEVFDYFVNNIPEPARHLYKTKITQNKEEQLCIYFRK